MIDLRFDSVSKKYLISQEEEGDQKARSLGGRLRRWWRRPREFWAVRNVSFEVHRGEALGIIGHNGAGKSTVLKLLASIVTPSLGEIMINGQLAALIEVGSGFHQELTGRENVYLSGSILGMRRSEITRKLDSIIEFSGIQEFIDTPVKRYSSGMFVRLGFSIAAHLDPDILLLDEVLAVGDASFQSKCLERVNDLRRGGKTILFISHDLGAVERLCDRVLLMQRGEVIANGAPAEVIDQYKNSAAKSLASSFQGIEAVREWPDLQKAPGDAIVRLRKVRVRTREGETAAAFDIRRPVGVEMTYDVLEPGHVLVPNYYFFNQEQQLLFYAQDLEPDWRGQSRPAGEYVSTAWIPGNFLINGSILVAANITSDISVVAHHIHVREAVAFNVIDNFDGDSTRGDYTGAIGGLIRPQLTWTTQFQEVHAANEYVLEGKAK